MGDSQDRQDATTPALDATPPTGPAEGTPDDTTAVHPVGEHSVPDDTEDETGLTGVLEALGAPEPEATPADDETAADPGPAGGVVDTVESDPIDPEIAALQTELETDSGAAEVAEGGPDAETAQSESLDDIAPGTVGGVQEAAEDAEAIVLPDDSASIPIWPFVVYFTLWVVFAGLLVWQSLQVPAGTPIYELQIYGLSILAGMILTALGPLLAISVWLALWLSRPRGARAGLFSRSLIIGAVTTLAGVALWLIALGVVDMLRLGRLI